MTFPFRKIAALAAGLIALGLLGGCDSEKKPFRIISGSENKTLEPIVKEFCEDEGWDCQFSYKGSVDIRLLLEEAEVPYDAVWPAHSRWIQLGDRRRRVKYAKSIMRSPVIIGIVRSRARALGLIGKPVSTQDLLTLVQENKLRFLMTSATQSNSGFSAYIGFLTTLAGKPEVLTDEHLNDATLKDKVAALLRGVQRSAGSSGWLKELFLAGAESGTYTAMVNYEAMLIEANQELVRRGREPLYLIYPSDGVAVADSPLGFVSHGDDAKEAFFRKLQAHLLSSKVQKLLADRGRRTGIGGAMRDADRRVFNPAWGIDVSKILPAIRFPAPATIDRALALYQETLRKPSLLSLCLDFSGSMKGAGVTQLKRAIRLLFDPKTSRRFMLQATSKDVFIVIPFNHRVIKQHVAVGPTAIRDLTPEIVALSTGGGTDIYACAAAALKAIRARPEFGSHNAAIILMTDGKSEENNRRAFEALYQNSGGDVPIYSITFGDADPVQLKTLAALSRARVFDGRKNLESAFRKARGYN